jgi:hypothetical protein
MQGHHQPPEKTSGSTRDGGPASSALLDAPYQVATDAAWASSPPPPTRTSRAPQNLCPIVGLERELRRRLDDPKVLYRALREAARPARRVPNSCPGQPGKTLADANNPLTPHGLSGPLGRSRF